MMVNEGTSLRQCIEELSAKNTDYKYPDQAINQAESLKSLSSDLYTDNIRFIYELIQNADDAQAKNIILTILEEKYLIITHDGKIFDEKDLQGLCGVNNGTKKKDVEKTGYKGLGFKAVFGKSDHVLIYSNGEYFRFDSSFPIQWNQEWNSKDQATWEKENERQFTYPWQINPLWTDITQIPSSLQTFFHSKRKQIRVAYTIRLHHVQEIHLALEQLMHQPYMFLFLRSIGQMTFLTPSSNTISITRNVNHGLYKVNINRKLDSQWIVKRFDLDIPEDVRNQLSKDTKAPEKLRFLKKVEMFFAVRYRDPGLDHTGGIEKLREEDSVLFSYLPTKISEYRFPVLINASFLTNVNREQIHTDSVWNQWLFERIGCEIFQWIKELVKDQKFRFQAYRLIPSKLTSMNNILSKRFNESFLRTLTECHFILNRQNQLLKVNEVIMDSTCMSRQPSFINIHSMRQYIIDNERNPSQYAVDPFIDYDSNLHQIGVKEFTWHQCIDLFQSEIFLQKHSIEENKRMIEYFHSKYEGDIAIEEIPFLLDQNNRLQSIVNIYFPGETIGESGTSDSDELFVHKTIFAWLNGKPQKTIKQWLKEIGLEERTDLAYLRKTIIPNATTFITLENAIKTIRVLFMLFRTNTITKKELDQLKKLNLLTIRGNLVVAERCFFSDQYKARLQLEEYLKTEDDRFLSFEYVTTNEELTEWRRFFVALGVQEELHPIVFDRKLTAYEAAGYGFCEEYLSTTSPDEKHSVDAFSGLTTITFLQYTKNNYEFARFFWSDVVKNIPAEILTRKVRIYWGHSNRRGAIDGTLLDESDYISWFVRKIRCIPTTERTCQLSRDVFADNKELRDLCGNYMYFSSISLPQDRGLWCEIFGFKTKLSINDYFDLLEKIRRDEKTFKDNLDRIQLIYFHIMKVMYYWSSDEKKTAKARAKSLYLLTENDQWKLASELYLYMVDIKANNNLNDAIPCFKLDYKNRNHPHLNEFLELLNIRQIRMNDLKLADRQSSPAEHFRQKLIEISPFLKKWLKDSAVSSDVISSIDRKIQQENDFIESESLQLFYHQKFVRATSVYYDYKHRQLYVTRPWDSETTFINLPYGLCQLLGISGFEKNIRFLLKGTIEEIQKHFNANSIEIPTSEDIVILEVLPRNDVLKQQKLSEPNNPVAPVINKEIAGKKPEMRSTITETLITHPPHPKSTNEPLFIVQPCPFLFYNSTEVPVPPTENRRRQPSTTGFVGLENEHVENLELIDLSSMTTSNSMLFPSSPEVTEESSEIDLHTGRLGEQMAYKYLLNKYHDQLDSVTIKWLNRDQETNLPYDILLMRNGRTYLIEVKSTRTYNRHIFPLSINQIETFLQQRENYFIYRVYIDEKKIVILDNIRWRLMQKQQLACLLKILPTPSA